MRASPCPLTWNSFPCPGRHLAPNLTFSPDRKTIYVMAVDDKSGAPNKGKVYAIPNE
ncbi:MAG: hypothetical protein ACREE7_08795 [Dongiaceae bacterium]